MTINSGEKVPLDALINAGESQQQAVQIAPGIYMSQDVSNVYLITSREGDVLINTGSSRAAERHLRLFAEVGAGAQRYVIITQSHGDHYGGLAKLKAPIAQLIVQARYPEGVAYRRLLSDFYVPRTNRLWQQVVGDRMNRSGKKLPEFTHDILVDDHYQFMLGGRRFEVLSVPGGETLDSLAVWLPQERIVFSGNVLGPAWLNLPNLNTVRGDKPRSVLEFIRSVDRIRALKPEILVTGHGDPIRGADVVEAGLKKIRDGVQSIFDQTIAGMNAGKDVHTLMREVKLPPDLQLEQWHGKVSWNVKAIWLEYTGWFHYESTTELYDVPAKAVANDIVTLAGGVKALINRATEHVAAGRPLEALHLIDIAIAENPDSTVIYPVKRAALELLLARSGEINFSETMWLKSEIAALDRLEQ